MILRGETGMSSRGANERMLCRTYGAPSLRPPYPGLPAWAELWCRPSGPRRFMISFSDEPYLAALKMMAKQRNEANK
jgi:hypothetical protein